MDLAPELVEIRLDNEKKTMLAVFSDNQQFNFSFEFLRVYSPSAEVRGHTEAESVLQTGKINVALVGVEPAGRYALKLVFDRTIFNHFSDGTGKALNLQGLIGGIFDHLI